MIFTRLLPVLSNAVDTMGTQRKEVVENYPVLDVELLSRNCCLLKVYIIYKTTNNTHLLSSDTIDKVATVFSFLFLLLT